METSVDILTTLPAAPRIPEPSRPFHLEGYGIPRTAEGMLAWSQVGARLAAAKNYWIATVRANGRPHAVPAWGIWFNDTLFFGGGPDTLWSRNLAARPEVAVHLEDGNEVVIIEGRVARILDQAVMEPIDQEYLKKYDMRHGPPVWVLQPRKVLAWTEYPTTVTRWQFD